MGLPVDGPIVDCAHIIYRVVYFYMIIEFCQGTEPLCIELRRAQFAIWAAKETRCAWSEN